jgi:hypothetical protein
MKLYTMAAVAANASQNVLLSPFGIGELLTLALIKSDGTTRDQIAKVKNLERRLKRRFMGIPGSRGALAPSPTLAGQE